MGGMGIENKISAVNMRTGWYRTCKCCWNISCYWKVRCLTCLDLDLASSVPLDSPGHWPLPCITCMQEITSRTMDTQDLTLGNPLLTCIIIFGYDFLNQKYTTFSPKYCWENKTKQDKTKQNKTKPKPPSPPETTPTTQCSSSSDHILLGRWVATLRPNQF